MIYNIWENNEDPWQMQTVQGDFTPSYMFYIIMELTKIYTMLGACRLKQSVWMSIVNIFASSNQP